MGTYSKAKLVKLDQALRTQHDEKVLLKKRHRDTEKVLRSAEWISRWAELPLPYVRRYAWESGLDPFPGPKKNNDIWLAAFSMIYLGWPCRLASETFGFTIPSIEQYARKAGWKRYVIWGLADHKQLAIPKPFDDEKWKITRIPTANPTAGVNSGFHYFSKKHH